MTYFSVFSAIVGAYIFILVCSSPYGVFNAFKKDDTDGVKRSGLVIYVDQKTGIEYVGTALGGLTVRLDADGKPMKVNITNKQCGD